jgi:hypothetical protein
VADILRVPSSSLNSIRKEQLAILETQLKRGEQSKKNTNWKISLQNGFRDVHSEYSN